jgi:hypothetical protein
MIKKYLVHFLAVLILMCRTGVASIPPHVYLKLSDDIITIGDTVNLELGLTQVDSIRSVLLYLNYDEKYFRYLSWTSGWLFRRAFLDGRVEGIAGDSSTLDSMVILVGVNMEHGYSITAPGPLFSINFTAIDSGNTVFKLDSLNFLNPDLHFIAGTCDSLAVRVEPSDTFPPDPVYDFKVREAGSGKLNLSWRNPSDADYQGTMILRSTRDFIRSVDTTQTIVYQGSGSNFTDENLVNGKFYYYTAFAYDEIPNYSKAVFLKGEPKGEYIYAYPNPFDPNDGVRFSVFFPYDTYIDITIYDAVGNRVIDLYKNVRIYANVVNTDLEWNGRNKRNDVVANGAYYYVVKTSQGDQKIEKLAVLR